MLTDQEFTNIKRFIIKHQCAENQLVVRDFIPSVSTYGLCYISGKWTQTFYPEYGTRRKLSHPLGLLLVGKTNNDYREVAASIFKLTRNDIAKYCTGMNNVSVREDYTPSEHEMGLFGQWIYNTWAEKYKRVDHRINEEQRYKHASKQDMISKSMDKRLFALLT